MPPVSGAGGAVGGAGVDPVLCTSTNVRDPPDGRGPRAGSATGGAWAGDPGDVLAGGGVLGGGGVHSEPVVGGLAGASAGRPEAVTAAASGRPAVPVSSGRSAPSAGGCPSGGASGNPGFSAPGAGWPTGCDSAMAASADADATGPGGDGTASRATGPGPGMAWDGGPEPGGAANAGSGWAGGIDPCGVAKAAAGWPEGTAVVGIPTPPPSEVTGAGPTSPTGTGSGPAIATNT